MRRIKILRKAKRELRFRGANGICTAIASELIINGHYADKTELEI